MTLEVFVLSPRKLTIAGRDIEILPLRMKQVPGFTAGIRPVIPLLMLGDLNKAIIAHPQGMIDAVVIGSTLDKVWVEELLPDDFCLLAGAVFEVNADFFARRVLPALRVAGKTLTETIQISLGEPYLPGS